MPTPRFLGSRFLFWLLAPWLVLGCAAFGLVAQDATADGSTVEFEEKDYYAHGY